MKTSCICCQGTITERFSWDQLVRFNVFQSAPFIKREEWLCSSCIEQLQWLEDDCVRCSRSRKSLQAEYWIPYRSGGCDHADGEQQICYDCYRWLEWEYALPFNQPVLTVNRSIVEYDEQVQHLVEQYKFRGDQRLKYFFATMLAEKWDELRESKRISRLIDQVDVIIPIPLSAERLLERGFNQASLVARLFADGAELPYAENVLLRTGDQGKQSKKTRNERLKEMVEKFLINPEADVDICNRSVCLVDDVYTTGATLCAAAYTLKQAGAKQVISLTIAR